MISGKYWIPSLKINMSDIKKIKNGLLKSQDIIGKEKYTLSSVLVPFVEIDKKIYLLFQKRSGKINQGGEICFPGGKFDPRIDKKLKDTALRESIEELGLKKKLIKIFGYLGAVIARMGVIVEVFLGKLKIYSINELNINKEEAEKVFTLPLDFFKENKPLEYSVRVEIQPSYIDADGNEIILFPTGELMIPEKYRKPWTGKNERVFVYKTDEGIIWGITAEIINKLINLI